MLSRIANVRKVLPRTLARAFSSEADATSVTLNFSVPYESIYNGASVFRVIIPGAEGEYGVTPGHVPYVAQLKPGVLQILHEESLADAEKYFVAGGYALTHENSVTVSSSCSGARIVEQLYLSVVLTICSSVVEIQGCCLSRSCKIG